MMSSLPNSALRKQLVIFLTGAICALWATAAWNSKKYQEDAISQAEKYTSTLTLAFAENTESTFQRVDYAIRQLRDAWTASPEGFADATLRIKGLLADTTVLIAVINAEGQVVYSDSPAPPQGVSAANRLYFTTLRNSQDDGLFVGPPILGQITGKWSIPLARPILVNGRFAGVILITIDPSYFVRFYHKAGLGAQGVLAITHYSGEIMARSKDLEKHIGVRHSRTPYSKPDSPGSGIYRRISEADGTERIYCYHKLPAYNVIAITAVGVTEQLAPVIGERNQLFLVAGIATLVLLTMAFAMWQGIARREEAERKIALAASVFTHAREGIVITGPDGVIVNVNAMFTEISGYDSGEVTGQDLSLLRWGYRDPEFYPSLWRSLAHQGYFSGEVWCRKKDGAPYALILTMSAVRDANDETMHYVALLTDITQIKQHQRQLEHLANSDALTGLPNRTLYFDRLRQAIAQEQRRKKCVAVLYLDLDGFKDVNDQHGHDVGDELLIQVARRMKTALREGDTLARMGGDEFAAVLMDLETPADVEPVLLRLLQAAADPVSVKGLTLGVTASIGVSFYPKDQSDADLLLRYADQAMYQAKQSGKNRRHVFGAEREDAPGARA